MIFPIVLILVFAGVQTALYMHARSVALSAAQEGSRAAAAEDANSGTGSQAANAFLARAGGADALPAASVSSNRTATEAVVTVTGVSLSVVPLMGGISISQSSSMAVERLTQ